MLRISLKKTFLARQEEKLQAESETVSKWQEIQQTMMVSLTKKGANTSSALLTHRNASNGAGSTSVNNVDLILMRIRGTSPEHPV